MNELVNHGLSIREAEFFCRFAGTIRLSAFEPAFRKGRNWDLNYCNTYDKSVIFSFLRYNEGKAFLVAANFSDNALETEIFVPQKNESYKLRIPAWEYTVKPL